MFISELGRLSIKASDVATTLYPHQKKALTFLLERERENSSSDGKFSSLWQNRVNPITGARIWYHIVTQKEVSEEPPDCKGAILADDVRTLRELSRQS
jgi:SWI/SNF-related matrix-associated actin-dependent regulator of chromatin subfamily A3